MSSQIFTWFTRADVAHGGVEVELDDDGIKQWLAEPLTGYASKATLPLWCPARFEARYRNQNNVLSNHGCLLDIDEPTSDFDGLVREIYAALGQSKLAAYTTFSSQPGAYKSRVFLPYATATTPEQHRAGLAFTMLFIERRVGVALDHAPSNPASGFYPPAIPPSGVYKYLWLDGEPWPIAYAAEKQLKLEAAERAQRERQAKLVVSRAASSDEKLRRAQAYLAKCEPAVQGAHGSRTTFITASKLVRWFALSEQEALALMLADYNPRCVPPWTERDLARKVHEAAEKARHFAHGVRLNEPKRRS